MKNAVLTIVRAVSAIGRQVASQSYQPIGGYVMCSVAQDVAQRRARTEVRTSPAASRPSLAMRAVSTALQG